MKPVDLAIWAEVAKAQCSCSNAYGKTNLHHQIQLEASGQHANVMKLLDWGSDPNAVYGPTLMTPLHMGESIQTVGALLYVMMQLLTTCLTPYICSPPAASWHRPELVVAILKAGGDPNIADGNGLQPLHCASIYGDVDSVRALVMASDGAASVNAVATTLRGDMTPLDWSIHLPPDHPFYACIQFGRRANAS